MQFTIYIKRRLVKRRFIVHTVELYDCFSCDGHWCLVEELLDYDLNRLSRIRVLSIQDIYCLSRDISRYVRLL